MAKTGVTRTPEELKGIHSKFVETVSDNSFKELFDILVKDGVLSGDEKTEILQKPNREERARAFFHAATSKGFQAQKKLKDLIEAKDPKLAAELEAAEGHNCR